MPACDVGSAPTRRPRAALYLLALAGIAAVVAGLSWAFPQIVYRGFVEPYFWRPIVQDEGYNPVNTASLLVIAFVLGGWIYELLRRFEIRIDFPLILAPLLLQPAGAMLRALEDSDFFAPFSEDIALVRPDLPPGATCVPEVAGGFLQDCIGVFFVAPPIFVWLTLLLGAFGRTAHWGEIVARAFGTRAGVRFFLLSMAALLALGLAWERSNPTYVRFVAPAWWLVLSLGAGAGAFFWLLRRIGRYDWRAALFSYSVATFLWVGYYVIVWLSGGRAGWGAGVPTRPFVLAIGLAITVLFVLAVRFQARRMGGAGEPRRPGVARAWAFLGYLAVLQGLALFFASGALLRATGSTPMAPAARYVVWWLVGGLLVPWVGLGLARLFASRRGAEPSAAALADPTNLLLLGSQYADALMTSIGIDLYGATEKHVLPRTLIAWVDALSLPAGLGDFPTLLVMVPYKLLLALLLIWVLDVRLRDALAPHPNVSPLAKGIAMVVGFSPAFRDGLRLSMGV